MNTLTGKGGVIKGQLSFYCRLFQLLEGMLGWQMAYVIPAVIQNFQSPQVSLNLCNQLFLFEKIPSLFFKKFLF